ncbi:hypothetical protein BJ912DRAFT_62267 [Pholiota molesta]|nr:hypothetical protein BJ912DRAFT_62267 [Pholiota molesta]
MSAFPTHTHHSEYADPVMRVPSPASSVGTSYGADQTAHSDSEAQLSPAAFARKCSERIGLHLPRTEEFRADQDPLLTVLTPQGRFVRASERDVGAAEVQTLHERVMASLRAEVAQLREDALFEQILLRRSQAALDVRPVTRDIDALMRSMMGPGMQITAGPHMGKSAPPPPPLGENGGTGAEGAGVTDGPWNHWGQPAEAERRYSMLSGDPMLSGTTVGKRSRNGTARKA